MSEHLNDKEIALELTKAYLDHVANIELSNNQWKSRPLTANSTAFAYQYFLNTVTHKLTFKMPNQSDKIDDPTEE